MASDSSMAMHDFFNEVQPELWYFVPVFVM